MNDNRSIQVIYDFIATFFSIVRLIIHVRLAPTPKISRNNDKCVIMGNGPSLAQTLSNSSTLGKYDLIGLNFMGTTTLYTEIKPSVYVICDPGLWFAPERKELHDRVRELYDAILAKTTWDLQFFIPAEAFNKKWLRDELQKNTCIRVCFYNKTKFEGFRWLENKIYNKQWGMPRAQNVLIPCLMLSLYSGYREIYLAGAENNWMQDIRVNKDNTLIQKEEHFYEDKVKETKAILHSGDKFHDRLLLWYFTFKSYVRIAEYAKRERQKIYNATPSSYIDAFERKPLN